MGLVWAATVTVLWVGGLGGPPPPASRHALDEWAEARGVRLVEPSPSPASAIAVDPSLADAAEGELERARDAITEQDAALADASLARAEALLRSHPELPQAAWLLAEVLRARAARWQTLAPRDPARAADAWARASVLDGGRVPGVGEVGRPGVEHGVSTKVLLDGLALRPGDAAVVALDGRATPGPSRGADALTLTGAAGEHHLRVTTGGAVVWAGYVTFGAGAEVRATVRQARPCSHADLERARLTGDRVDAGGVTCASWVAAESLTDSSGEILVATCDGETCGALLRWQVGAFGPAVPESRREHGWPAWATWTLTSAAVVAVATATLAASGVFRPTHEEPLFVTGGLHVASDLSETGR